MKTRYLFPHGFKKIGWIILIPASIFGLLWFLGIISLSPINIQVLALERLGSGKELTGVNDIIDEIFGVLIITGVLLAAFSEEKDEDEYISRIRLESLLWATYINYGLLFLAILFIYDTTFFQILVFNMFTLLIIFLIRFNFILFQTNKVGKDEE